MSILAQRFLFGFLLLGGVLLVLLLDGGSGSSLGFLLLVLAFLAGGWIEFVRMTRLGRATAAAGLVYIVAAAFIYGWLLEPGQDPRTEALLLVLLPVAWPGWLFVMAARSTPMRGALSDLALASLGMLWLLFPILCCLRLRTGFGDRGLVWVAALILIVKGNDIGAYLVGRWLGRTPLSPISPRKTREGAAGGLVLGVIVALGFACLTDPPIFGWAVALVIGAVVGVAGQLGDLAESYLKRCCDVKNSGALVPTYGGVLDLLDSLLFGAPVLYLLGSFFCPQ